MPKPVEESFFDDYELPSKRKKKAVVKPRAPRVTADSQSPTVVHPTGEVAQANKVTVFQARPKTRDWDFEEAVKVLEPLLHPDTKVEYAYILDPFYDNNDLRLRAEEWRKRNGKI